MTAQVGDDAVERYLDDLFVTLRGEPRACRRLLDEVQAHLLDAVDAGLATGLTREEAAERAVRSFGPPEDLLGAGPSVPVTAARILRPLIVTGAGLAAAGMLAVGASGVLAAVLRSTAGDRFLAGDLPGSTYTPARCADFFEYAPHASTCLAAAASHHADEVVGYRLAAGILGVLALIAFGLLRRWWRPVGAAMTLPVGFASGVAAALFGVAAGVAWLASVNSLTLGGPDGTGQNLSAAVVATLAAGLFVIAWLRAVGRTRARLAEGAP